MHEPSRHLALGVANVLWCARLVGPDWPVLADVDLILPWIAGPQRRAVSRIRTALDSGDVEGVARGVAWLNLEVRDEPEFGGGAPQNDEGGLPYWNTTWEAPALWVAAALADGMQHLRRRTNRRDVLPPGDIALLSKLHKAMSGVEVPMRWGVVVPPASAVHGLGLSAADARALRYEAAFREQFPHDVAYLRRCAADRMDGVQELLCWVLEQYLTPRVPDRLPGRKFQRDLTDARTHLLTFPNDRKVPRTRFVQVFGADEQELRSYLGRDVREMTVGAMMSEMNLERVLPPYRAESSVRLGDWTLEVIDGSSPLDSGPWDREGELGTNDVHIVARSHGRGLELPLKRIAELAHVLDIRLQAGEEGTVVSPANLSIRRGEDTLVRRFVLRGSRLTKE